MSIIFLRTKEGINELFWPWKLKSLKFTRLQNGNPLK